MYTKTQLCSHFDISAQTFARYRAEGIIAAPHVAGNSRYYTTTDLQRIRGVRQFLDTPRTIADYAEAHPHPALPHPPPDDEVCDS